MPSNSNSENNNIKNLNKKYNKKVTFCDDNNNDNNNINNNKNLVEKNLCNQEFNHQRNNLRSILSKRSDSKLDCNETMIHRSTLNEVELETQNIVDEIDRITRESEEDFNSHPMYNELQANDTNSRKKISKVCPVPSRIKCIRNLIAQSLEYGVREGILEKCGNSFIWKDNGNEVTVPQIEDGSQYLNDSDIVNLNKGSKHFCYSPENHEKTLMKLYENSKYETSDQTGSTIFNLKPYIPRVRRHRNNNDSHYYKCKYNNYDEINFRRKLLNPENNIKQKSILVTKKNQAIQNDVGDCPTPKYQQTSENNVDIKKLIKKRKFFSKLPGSKNIGHNRGDIDDSFDFKHFKHLNDDMDIESIGRPEETKFDFSKLARLKSSRSVFYLRQKRKGFSPQLTLDDIKVSTEESEILEDTPVLSEKTSDDNAEETSIAPTSTAVSSDTETSMVNSPSEADMISTTHVKYHQNFDKPNVKYQQKSKKDRKNSPMSSSSSLTDVPISKLTKKRVHPSKRRASSVSLSSRSMRSSSVSLAEYKPLRCHHTKHPKFRFSDKKSVVNKHHHSYDSDKNYNRHNKHKKYCERRTSSKKIKGNKRKKCTYHYALYFLIIIIFFNVVPYLELDLR